MQIKTSYNGEPFVYIIPNENPLSCFYLEKEKNGMYACIIYRTHVYKISTTSMHS